MREYKVTVSWGKTLLFKTDNIEDAISLAEDYILDEHGTEFVKECEIEAEPN